VTRNRINLAGLCLGAVLTSAGGLEAYQLFHRIALQLQGKCDWLPCANDGTYHALGLYLALAVFGVVVLGLAFWRLRKP
jgi:hypothetical protein